MSEAVLKAFKEINSFNPCNSYNNTLWYSISPSLGKGNWGTERFRNLLKVTSNHLTYHLQSWVLQWVSVTRSSSSHCPSLQALFRHGVSGQLQTDSLGPSSSQWWHLWWPPSGHSSGALWCFPSDYKSEFSQNSWLVGERQLDANPEKSFQKERREQWAFCLFICFLNKEL